MSKQLFLRRSVSNFRFYSHAINRALSTAKFDNLTVRELKKLLQERNVAFSSSTRKPELLKLAQESEPANSEDERIPIPLESSERIPVPLETSEIPASESADDGFQERKSNKIVAELGLRKGFLLGRGGSRIKEIQAKSRVGPTFNDDGFAEIVGSWKGISQFWADLQENLRNETRTIPETLAPIHSMKDELEERHQVLINISKRSGIIITPKPGSDDSSGVGPCFDELLKMNEQTKTIPLKKPIYSKKALSTAKKELKDSFNSALHLEDDCVYIYCPDPEKASDAVSRAMEMLQPTMEFSHPFSACVREIPQFKDKCDELGVLYLTNGEVLDLYGEPEKCQEIVNLANELAPSIREVQYGIRGVILAATSRHREIQTETGAVIQCLDNWHRILVWGPNSESIDKAIGRCDNYINMPPLCFNLQLDLVPGIALIDQGRVRAQSGAIVSRKRFNCDNNVLIAGSPFQVHAAYDAIFEDIENIVEIECGASTPFFTTRVIEKIAELSGIGPHHARVGSSSVAFRGDADNLVEATKLVQNVLENTVELVVHEPLSFEVKCALSNELIKYCQTDDSPGFVRFWDGKLMSEEYNRKDELQKQLVAIPNVKEFLRHLPHCWINTRSSKRHWDDLFT